MKIIAERKLWEIVGTGRENVNNTRVIDDVITHDKTEYFSHSLAEVMDGEIRNEGILITRSKTGK